MYAEIDNPETCGTYRQAVEAVSKYGLDGIGIVLKDGLLGIDLDHVVTSEGETIAAANYIIQTMNSYTEKSPSGDGFHILALGSLPPKETRQANKNFKDETTGRIYKIEAYDSGRYFTVTGNVINSQPINERTQQAAIICETYLPLETKEQGQHASVADNSTSDSILQKGEERKKRSAIYCPL